MVSCFGPWPTHRTPRYAFGSNTAFRTMNARDNVFEYNIISETNFLSTDTGAIEALGSGNPDEGTTHCGSDCGSVSLSWFASCLTPHVLVCPPAPFPWFTNTSIRFNNISLTQGLSKAHGGVCVHGVPAAGCRGLVWGIYLV